MNMSMKKVIIYLLLVVALWACKSTGQLSTGQEYLFTIGDTAVPTDEFVYVYNKNNVNKDSIFDRSDVEDYLDLFINFKLKVKEAKILGLDQKDSFKKELEGYRKQLAKPYLTESKATDDLVKEAYERLKYEINASHILINVQPNAAPKDTLAAFNKIIGIRNDIVNGKTQFAEAAKLYSQDPSAERNGGNLGYFSAFQMVYPFETASFNTNVGDISMPFRTRFGYHIVSVDDRRPSRGKVKVAHIMIRSNEGMPEELKKQNKEKIEEIRKKLTSGVDWDQLCSQFSQDLATSKKGGMLPWIGSGNVDPQFEAAAFGLQAKGELSAPVLTPYGWHIIKLEDKQPLEAYDELASQLKERIEKDSRSRLNKKMLINRLKTENDFVANQPVIDQAITEADSSLLNANWLINADHPSTGKTLFTIKNLNFKTDSFFQYVVKKQRARPGIPQKKLMKEYFEDYVGHVLTLYEEDQLSEKYLDYRMLLKEYNEGIMLFELMDEKVWTKAVKDTVGLNHFFNQNKNNYHWKERVDAIIFDAANEQVIQEVKTLKDSSHFIVDQLILKMTDGKIDPEKEKNVDDIINQLINDKRVKVVINSTAGNLNKAKSIKEYMFSKGVNEESIELNEGGVDHVMINVLSLSAKELEKKFNTGSPLNLQISEGLFEKKDKDILSKIDWVPGESSILSVDNRFYWLVVNHVVPKAPKALNEIKGVVISDYQNQLESDWLKELKEKYPVKINKIAFENAIRKLEKL